MFERLIDPVTTSFIRLEVPHESKGMTYDFEPFSSMRLKMHAPLSAL